MEDTSAFEVKSFIKFTVNNLQYHFTFYMFSKFLPC